MQPLQAALGQPEPLSCSVAVSPHHLGHCAVAVSGTVTLAIFQIAGNIANGCYLGGIGVDGEWSIYGDAVTGFPIYMCCTRSCMRPRNFSCFLRKEVEGQCFQIVVSLNPLRFKED